MTMGLACDRDGYDLRSPQCPACGSRGCHDGRVCNKTVVVPTAPPQWFVDVWSAFEAEKRATIPNRLHGAYINKDGDAV